MDILRDRTISIRLKQSNDLLKSLGTLFGVEHGNRFDLFNCLLASKISDLKKFNLGDFVALYDDFNIAYIIKDIRIRCKIDLYSDNIINWEVLYVVEKAVGDNSEVTRLFGNQLFSCEDKVLKLIPKFPKDSSTE